MTGIDYGGVEVKVLDSCKDKDGIPDAWFESYMGYL